MCQKANKGGYWKGWRSSKWFLEEESGASYAVRDGGSTQLDYAQRPCPLVHADVPNKGRVRPRPPSLGNPLVDVLSNEDFIADESQSWSRWR